MTTMTLESARRRVVAPIVALALALMTAPAGAQIDLGDDPTDVFCSVAVPPSPDRGCAPLPLPSEATAIAVILPTDPSAGDLYRSLIPAPFSAPNDEADYRISFMIFWLEIPPTPGSDGNRDSQYMEGQYALWAQRDGKEGWFQLHVPVADDSLYGAGRSSGLPKYLADMALTDGGGMAHTYAVLNPDNPAHDHGPELVDMKFTASGETPSDELRRLVNQSNVFFGSCPHLDGAVVPGDYAERQSLWWDSKYTLVPSATVEAGSVQLTIHPGENVDWVDLLPCTDPTPSDGDDFCADPNRVLEYTVDGGFGRLEGLVIATWDAEGDNGGSGTCE